MMSLILVTNRAGRTRKFTLGMWQGVLLLLSLALVIAGAIYWGMQHPLREAPEQTMLKVMKQQLAEQEQALARARAEAEENLNALALRLGEVKAHVIRLDALGQRLIEKANLSKGEFDFENPPAQGGPVSGEGRGKSMAVSDFIGGLDAMERQLEHRALQLDVLETLLMNRELHDEVFPQGRPIKRGWISSYFGYRTDPFNGRIAHHDGIDLAGELGSDVIAVASGVVTWAGKRYGYGNLVEINHGNGYVTRYGHNQKINVKVGQTVKKGEVIAQMGSSGRSTGPHVHFEVIKNSRVVDPMRYIRAAR